MNKTIFIALLFFLNLIMMYTALAAITSSRIDIKGTYVVQPNNKLELPLSQLMENINYTLRCDIYDENNAINPVIMRFSVTPVYADYDELYLDGYPYGTQVPLPAVDSTLKIATLRTSWPEESNLIFQNVDQDDAVVVSNCYAVAEAG